MDYETVIVYTWHDIERRLLQYRDNWPEKWIKIDVFSTEIVIYVEEDSAEVHDETGCFLKEVLKQYYNVESNRVEIEITRTVMDVCMEETAREKERNPFPLFRDFTYVKGEAGAEESQMDSLAIPVVAFHSYKGGVGRTLSLIAIVREIINLYGREKKVLIVDGDMEAPGLTWLGRKDNNYAISYLDVLAVIGAKGNQKDIIEDISQLVKRSSLVFQGDQMELEQYFLPTYREEGQMLDIYSNPERIMMGESNKYIITDTLAQIGYCLGTAAVLVDLRAGFSEYSSPFLFDPRVDKFLVSSTSLQSISGTNLILRELKKQRGNEDAVRKIILTMVDKDKFRGKDRDEAYRLLLQKEELQEADSMAEELQAMDSVEELQYSEQLIYLGDLEQICEKLKLARETTKPLREGNIVRDICEKKDGREKTVGINYDRQKIVKFRRALHEICEKSVTAEGGDISNMLATRAVLQLGNFTREVPRINVLGAKGSGKTYLYTQMLKAQTWERFLKVIGKSAEDDERTLICPVLCSEDRGGLRDILTRCRERCSAEIPQMKIESDFLTKNSLQIKEAIKQQLSEPEWQEFWQNLILSMFGGLTKWGELQAILEKQNRKIIFLFDGLENVFENFEKDPSEKCGIRTLCRGIVNLLSELYVSNIGVIVFMRKDIAELSINTNYEQFRNQYVQYELNWTQKDALQLALKLAERAGKVSGVQWRSSSIPVEDAGRDIIEEELTAVWGTKMGTDSSRQADATRWVLASLSDFNGQLQARDIVRFLAYASKYEFNTGKKTTGYADRFLTPDDMKQAIRECSREKFLEVENEIHQLKSSFQKLQNMEQKDKYVPLPDEVLEKLGVEDKRNLERFGYLKEADGEYYISESIRYALGYNKAKRGGIKLVSLLVNK